MIIIRGPSFASSIPDTGIRALVEQRFREILAGEPYDYDSHGEMVVVESWGARFNNRYNRRWHLEQPGFISPLEARQIYAIRKAA